MKRFGVLMATAALGAVLAASGPAWAKMGGMGGGHPMAMPMGDQSHAPILTTGRSVAVTSPGMGANWGHAWHGNWGHGWHQGWHNAWWGQHHHFHNRFAFLPFFVGGGWNWGYPYGDYCYWGNSYCGYPSYAYSYPDYQFDTSYYSNGYGNGYDYGYRATGSSGYYAAAPLVTGRSAATGQLGSYCTISVKTCELHHPSYVGGACSCRVPGGRARGLVAH